MLDYAAPSYATHDATKVIHVAWGQGQAKTSNKGQAEASNFRKKTEAPLNDEICRCEQCPTVGMLRIGDQRFRLAGFDRFAVL